MTYFFEKPKDFLPYMKHVVGWNALFHDGKHNFSKEMIEFQKDLVLEEFEELKKAIEEENKVEVLDALIDLFVVASYWYYLTNSEQFLRYSSFLVPDGFMEIINIPEILSGQIKADDPYLTLLVILSILSNFDGVVSKAIENVLESNDSKFPVYSVFYEDFNFTYEKEDGKSYPLALYLELQDIEEKFKGRYSGIDFKIIVDADGNERVAFFDDKGKIMKSSLYRCPELAQYC